MSLSCKTLGNKLVPNSNCRQMRIDVFFTRSLSRAITRSSASLNVSLEFLTTALSASDLRMRGSWALNCAGVTRARSSKSSSIKGPASPPPLVLSSARKMPRALLTSSDASLVLSPGRGPIEPKTGSILNWTPECTTRCSASSILPMPVAPSSTMTPPSCNGPSGGFSACPDRLITCSPECRSFKKPPPSHFDTVAMPSHDLTLQRSQTFRWCWLAPRALEVEAPPKGASCQGKRTFRLCVSPICMSASFLTGSKIGVGSCPSDLIGCSAW
mmetsp:Transcript_12850/g.38684  ORF Transcript_12850/g.38684 Transcript_12850/m.38684 type:complete len:271 (+) Transcript_12850:908-1720(+)